MLEISLCTCIQTSYICTQQKGQFFHMQLISSDTCFSLGKEING